MSLERVLLILRRRAWIVLLCPVLVGGAVFLFSTLQTKEYTSTAQLLFRDPGIAAQASGLVTPADTSPERTGATNVRLVTLGDVALRAARALGGGITPGQVGSTISVSAQGQSDVVSVSATSASPALAARIANAFSQAFIARRRKIARQNVDSAVRLVQRQLASMPPGLRSGTRGQALQDRLESLQVLSRLQTGNVELGERATVPTSPSSPKLTRNTVLGLVLGLLLGLGLAFLVDRLDRRLREPEEAATALGRPLVGIIPASEQLARISLAASNGDLPSAGEQGGELEAFRMLRANLRYFNVGRELRTLLVTSAAVAEGKTTVAVNLARAAASTGARVLLVEADLRRPTLSKALGVRTPGLAYALVAPEELEDALTTVISSVAVQTGVDDGGERLTMDVIVAGATPPNPAELLAGERMALMIAVLRERYDTIVIDTPPLAVVSDAIPLIEQVDGMIIISRVGRSTRNASEHLRDRLHNLDAPVLGVVANDVNAGALAGYGYSYYSYSAVAGDG